ncbi:MAG: MAE_28990/MAE_18760 family HEPN-like nuclease, partial [Candidatus Sulfotelmatobacter sp.]
DDRARTLARIKTRSVGADTLTLTALSVLVYAQLEGGVKDLAACVIKDLNILRPNIGRIRPKLLVWRNPEEIDKFKARVDFDMIAAASPFASALAVPFQLKPINQRYELNQMDWKAIGKVYTGLGLDHAEINKLRTKIDEIVEDRNQAAHHGVLPATAAANMERQVREKVDVVETVLTDLCLQLLPFFSNALHARS